MTSYEVERAFVTLICDMVEKGKLAPRIRTHRDLAVLAFPDKGDKLWRSIRRGQNGKPQGVTIETALSLASAVGIDLFRLLVYAEKMIDDGWTLADDVKNRPVKGKGEKTGKASTADADEDPAVVEPVQLPPPAIATSN